jgi:hypothetical protein
MGALPPRRLRMRRLHRLQAAPAFIRNFTGKRLVVGYARWFGVDRLCAIEELRMLKVEIAEAEEKAARATVAVTYARRARRLALAAAAIVVDPDDDELETLVCSLE